MSDQIREFIPSFFHGTKAALGASDRIVPGHASNHVPGNRAKYVYFTSNLAVAVWGAELALGDGPGRIYVVEATGVVEDDPNVTDKRFPGNPTRSYRSAAALVVLGELTGWQGHPIEEILARKQALDRMVQSGAALVEE